MKKTALLTLLSTMVLGAFAQDMPIIRTEGRNDAFRGGERLEYVASYKIGIFNVDIASVVLEVSDSRLDGRETFRLNGVGAIDPDYEWFFKMRDEYNVWLDKESLRPLYFKNDIHEGDYRYYSHYTYDWDSLKVRTVERNLKWEKEKACEYDLTETSYDALSLFYNLRTKDIERMEIDKMDTLQVVFANRIRTVGFRYMGKEVKRIPGMGRVSTVKFICQLANDSGVSFQDGSEFTIWLSDDENLIPLYVYTPIRVGSVRVRLVDYTGVRTPVDLKIK